MRSVPTWCAGGTGRSRCRRRRTSRAAGPARRWSRTARRSSTTRACRTGTTTTVGSPSPVPTPNRCTGPRLPRTSSSPVRRPSSGATIFRDPCLVAYPGRLADGRRCRGRRRERAGDSVPLRRPEFLDLRRRGLRPSRHADRRRLDRRNVGVPAAVPGRRRLGARRLGVGLGTAALRRRGGRQLRRPDVRSAALDAADARRAVLRDDVVRRSGRPAVRDVLDPRGARPRSVVTAVVGGVVAADGRVRRGRPDPAATAPRRGRAPVGRWGSAAHRCAAAAVPQRCTGRTGPGAGRDVAAVLAGGAGGVSCSWRRTRPAGC